MNPNRQLNTVGADEFISIFSDAIDGLATYRGIKIDDDLMYKMLNMLYNITRGKYSNLVVNDVNIGIGQLYEQDIKKVTPQLLNSMLQKVSVEKFQKEDEQEQKEYTMSIDNSFFARAISLRIKHDPRGKILEQNKETLKDVMECVRDGFCYYTGERIKIE